MPYSAEVVRRARARLAQEKADRESENREHLQRAYVQVPRLRQIDIQLQHSVALAVRAAFTRGEDARQAIEQVKQANLALQREREALVAVSFEEGYLDDSPICNRCGGSGYVGTAMCQCLRELCRQEQKKELALLSTGKESFDRFRLDYYPERVDGAYGASPRQIMERNFEICRRYAQGFGPHSGNLLFVGGTGLGKTFLSACIAKAVADRGFSVAYETAPRLFSKLENDRFRPDEGTRLAVSELMTCDLLIVDDLGTEMTTEFVTAALYSLLNERLLTDKPMLISTNLNIEEAARRYSPQIASRLQGNFQRLTFVGEDIRVLKNRAR